MKTQRILLVFALAITFVLNVGSSSAQVYKRHALVEEGTGTWCGYCPFGAYALDSIEQHMGDQAVIISLHGPAGNQEPMFIAAQDTLLSYVKSGGFPYAVFGRSILNPGAPSPSAYPNDGWSQYLRNAASQAPLVDFRLVNTVYDPSSKSVDFDLDITPFNLSKMGKEDTTNYVTVAVLTEDGIVQSQHRYKYDNLDAAQIDDFHHYNVARQVAGKILGDPFTLGTKTSVSYPIRRHYHMKVANASWNVDSLRLKVFVAMASKNAAHGSAYLDANQTGYITVLPATPLNDAWVVLPRTKDVFSSDSTSLPIIWSKAGTGINTVTLNYSIDTGKTWTKIADGVNKSPYTWSIPDAAYGQHVMIQITNGAVTSASGLFSIAAKAAGVITVTAPAAGDVLTTGQVFHVQFNANSLITESRSIQYSIDGGTSWQVVAQINAASTYDWTVPNTPTTTGMLKVVDGNNIVGTSGTFTIQAAGVISKVTLKGVDGKMNIPQNQPLTIGWNATGSLGETVNLDVSYDNKQTWNPIVASYTFGTKNSYVWTTPSANYPNAIVRASFALGATGYSDPFSIGAAAGVNDGAAITSTSVVPNPMSSTASVNFGLKSAADVSLTVTDMLGREVANVAYGRFDSGNHQVAFDARALPAGHYAYRLVAGHYVTEGKITIVR